MPEPTKPDKKPSSTGNSTPNNTWLMYAICAVLLVAGGISVVASSMVERIPYPQLIDLIKNSKPNPDALLSDELGSITIDSGKTKVVLSNLRDVEVDIRASQARSISRKPWMESL